jgi:hypothetical protein
MKQTFFFSFQLKQVNAGERKEVGSAAKDGLRRSREELNFADGKPWGASAFSLSR